MGKIFFAILEKPEICRMEIKRMEDSDILRLKERMKPFQKEGYRITYMWTGYI